MMTEEEMAARDQALMGEHSNPDSVAISIPEDFTKSVPPQVGLVLYPACAPTHWKCGATGGKSSLADVQISGQGRRLQCPGDKDLGAPVGPAWSASCCASHCCCTAALPWLLSGMFCLQG